MPEQTLTLTCEDGYLLTAQLLTPETFNKAAVLIAPATGIKQSFYMNFARFLVAKGYTVMCFDYRGIGLSSQGKLKHHTARMQDWGELDLPAALDTLIRVCPNKKYHLIGHSVGGQVVGLMPNAHILTSLFTFASSSGNLNNFQKLGWLRAQFFMNVFIPLSNLILGYTYSPLCGMGEPLPKRVAAQWRQWCNGEGFAKTGFGKEIQTHYFDQLHQPALWVSASDDFIATELNVKEQIDVYKKLVISQLRLIPQCYQLESIGHMKFFSQHCRQLWPIALDWLDKNTDGDLTKSGTL